jgi:phenylacetate-CoA ligase
MHAPTLISTLYGELRGYHRLDIRRRVAANERLSPETLALASSRFLDEHVHRSIARFPLYAARVREHRGSLPTPGARVRLHELPIWTRLDQAGFFSEQPCPADSHYVHATGGSTGEVVRFHVTRESYEWRTAIADRVYAWAGAEEGARSLHVWAVSHHARPWPDAIKRRVHVALQRRTFFDVCREFTDEERDACCDLIERLKPAAIVGYTGMLVDLARYCRDHRRLRWQAPSVITTAEGLQCGQRELLQCFIADEVFDSYGSREFMNIGTECEVHNGYHINVDNLLVEVVDDDGQAVEPGVEGRLLVTDYRNAATPFIRYEIGDRGVLAPPDEVCPCGRPFPLLRRVEGRTQDMIHTPRGVVSALNVEDVLEHLSWVDGYQLVQASKDRLVIRLLTRGIPTADMLAPVGATLERQLGHTRIEFERVPALSRKPNGKIELVVSSLRGVA